MLDTGFWFNADSALYFRAVSAMNACVARECSSADGDPSLRSG
jgi:hypothetical protein